MLGVLFLNDEDVQRILDKCDIGKLSPTSRIFKDF